MSSIYDVMVWRNSYTIQLNVNNPKFVLQYGFMPFPRKFSKVYLFIYYYYYYYITGDCLENS